MMMMMMMPVPVMMGGKLSDNHRLFVAGSISERALVLGRRTLVAFGNGSSNSANERAGAKPSRFVGGRSRRSLAAKQRERGCSAE